jgi:2-polyprenyl-3-methyl-5-hydroxy-6-metoxy-1,4-benzoquinol methylase
VIQDLAREREPEEAPELDLEWLDSLRRLPQPLHLLEFVARSQHYHFGCFEDADESPRVAQDRLALLGAREFRAGGAVLDIGCGLGGTSRLLASRGFAVTAIDPCDACVTYAELRDARERRPPVRHEAATFEAFARASGTLFDGAIAIEILQHFPALETFFGACRARLRPGGVVVLADVALAPPRRSALGVPFHPAGEIRAVAERVGFRVVAEEDRTRQILPTLPALSHELERARARLCAVFGPLEVARARPVEDELAQLLEHMQSLQDAFERGYLRYETVVLVREPEREPRTCE